jgi:hypothetical protein
LIPICESPLGLPVLRLVPVCIHAVATTPAGSTKPVRSYRSLVVGLPRISGGSAPKGLLSVYSHYGLDARKVAFATLYTGGSRGFVAWATAPIVVSELVPGRELRPLWTSAFHSALRYTG